MDSRRTADEIRNTFTHTKAVTPKSILDLILECQKSIEVGIATPKALSGDKAEIQSLQKLQKELLDAFKKNTSPHSADQLFELAGQCENEIKQLSHKNIELDEVSKVSVAVSKDANEIKAHEQYHLKILNEVLVAIINKIDVVAKKNPIDLNFNSLSDEAKLGYTTISMMKAYLALLPKNKNLTKFELNIQDQEIQRREQLEKQKNIKQATQPQPVQPQIIQSQPVQQNNPQTNNAISSAPIQSAQPQPVPPQITQPQPVPQTNSQTTNAISSAPIKSASSSTTILF